MKNEIKAAALAITLIASTACCWADDVNVTGNNNDPLKHPVNAYRNHEVKEDMKDSQENSQKAAESKEAYKQAKDEYEKSLKDNGAVSDITKSAKKRMSDTRKEMNHYNKKTAKANRELRKDEIKAHQ